MEDLFSNERFDLIYEQLENSRYEKFEFHNSKGMIKHTFIKKEIPMKIDGETYYSLAAPYAYGGPIIVECTENNNGQLIEAFNRAFEAYCKENFVVCEHVRFHPIAGKVKEFVDYYELEYMGEAYGVNLSAFTEPAQEEFSTSCLKSIWRAVKAGVKYRIAFQPQSLKSYIQFYSEHAEKKEADFKYFLECGRVLKKNLVLVEAVYQNRVIGMSLNFLLNNVIQTHLSIIHPQFNSLSPAHIMHFGLAIWGKENGMSLIYDGGRLVINQQTHDLPIYKQQFSKHTNFQLWSGRRIWNEDVYRKLCKASNFRNWEDGFLQKY